MSETCAHQNIAIARACTLTRQYKEVITCADCGEVLASHGSIVLRGRR
jgi:hypothetical protein